MKHRNKIMLILIIIVFIVMLWRFVYLLKSNNQSKEQIIKLEEELDQVKGEKDKILNNQPPEIMEISFKDDLGNDLFKDGWVTVGEDNRTKITIKVKGNCTSIDMFMSPTGTETYTLQRMVGFITSEIGQNEFEYTWNVPKGTIGHFWIIAYNNNNGQRSEYFNIYNE